MCHKRFNHNFLGIGNDVSNMEKQIVTEGALQMADPVWCADSSATHHITHELDKLTTVEAYHIVH
jgi:hypothetical protein